jgi:predicted nicotinamide N-methyase
LPNDNCDFFDHVPRYRGNLQALSRLKARWKRVVQPVSSNIAHKNVLDLGAHDGRWAYAYVHAGAAHVTAVEGRLNLIKQLQEFPDSSVIVKITVVQNDIFSFLESAIIQEKKFHVVALLGFFVSYFGSL